MTATMTASPDSSAFAMRLARNIKGAVMFDPASRGRYSTDASIYQMDPVGVIVPETIDDVIAAMALAREEGVPVLPRGGGTSQCGQTVNRALVIDCTKHLRKVLHVDAEAQTAVVEPGIVLGHLNNALKGEKLFFPVDPSTHARCTIGGMTANNSCGAKSIRYGLMADNVRSIDAILPDGSRQVFGGSNQHISAGLLQTLKGLGVTEAEEIAARFPKQLRRVGGYNIDALTQAARAAGRGNLARILVGSEGTLAFSAAIELTLHPVKPRKVMGICQFPTFRKAMEASRHTVKLDPEAVELVDRTMIELGRGIPIYRGTIDRMLLGEPDSLLLVEFHGDADGPLLAKLDELATLMGDLGHPGIVHATDAGFLADIASVREAGLNIMMSMKGDGKPVSFIEDCAVDLDDLADYTERLNGVFEKYGSRGTWYAHASVGCLHVRPVLNMKDPVDVAKMRAVAEEAFALVREYKGSHSGEHGDGIARSEFHRQMFGSRIVRAFETVKQAFDPAGLMNPNRIVRPPRMDDRTLFRYKPGYAAVTDFQPRLDWSAYSGPLGGMLGAVEMCNNNGACRSFDSGVMCPSYRATRDEQHLTRGRANTLRLALSGQLGPDAMASDAMADVMALCVSCKGCRRECPTGVDMAKMKIEVAAVRASRHGVRLRERLVAMLPAYAPLAARVPWLMNLRNRVPALRMLMERVVGISAARPLPEWRSDRFRDAEASAAVVAAPVGEVYLLADTFNRYFEPENLRAAVRVLAASGYRVRMPTEQVCCGRTYLTAGMVDKARAEADRTMRAMPLDIPIVGLEPSCLLTLRDEFRSLRPGEATERFGKRAMLLSEFIARVKPDLALKALPGKAVVHGHCHQKAFGAFPDALAMLRGVPSLEVGAVASSCCGMAGAFGYQAETQEVSAAMAEAGLLPAVRAAGKDDVIVADGTSCRCQIRDLGGREAVHSVRVMERALEGQT